MTNPVRSSTPPSPRLISLLADVAAIAVWPIGMVDLLAMFEGRFFARPFVQPTASWLEILYDLATITITLTALIGLPYAKMQADNARRQSEIQANAARAEVYRLLSKDLLSPTFKQGIEVCASLMMRHSWRPFPAGGQMPLGEFVVDQISSMIYHDTESFVRLRDFLAFMESVGLQTRRNYLTKDDLHFILGGLVPILDDVLGAFLQLQNRRQPGAWEHTIWLFKTMRNYAPAEPLPD